MQKKRKIYLIAMIIVTALLAADLAVFALFRPRTMEMPSFENNAESSYDAENSAGDAAEENGTDENDRQKGEAEGAGDAQNSDGQTASEDMEQSDGQSAPGNMEKPDGQSTPEGMEKPDGQSAPEGMEKPDGQSTQEIGEESESQSASEDTEASDETAMPENGELPEEMELPDGENMPQGMENMTMPGADSAPWRIVCIPIAILLGIADLVLLLLFLRAKKQDSAPQEEGEEEIPEMEDPVEARMRKTRRNRIVIVVFLVLLVLLVVLLNTIAGGAGDATGMNVEEKVVDTTVESGDISQNLQGSGVVASLEAEEVTVPGSIEVTRYYVEDGDKVSAGDKIAAVDKDSVLAAIGEIEDLTEQLDAEMTEVKDSAGDQEIGASNDAVVIAVYAEEDADVLDTMYTHGALMLLSLDGRLSVDIDYEGDLGMEDVLTVTDEDGTSADGEVIDVRKDAITVAVDADDFVYGSQVKVTSGDTALGSGTLGVYNGQKVTGYAGTVEAVNVSVGSEVSAGDTLMTLTDLDYEAAYETLLAEREELEKQYNRLVEIAGSGYVYAEADGVISDINEDISTGQTDSVKAEVKQTGSTSGTTAKTETGKSSAQTGTATGMTTVYRINGVAAMTAETGICSVHRTGNTVLLTGGTEDAAAVLADAGEGEGAGDTSDGSDSSQEEQGGDSEETAQISINVQIAWDDSISQDLRTALEADLWTNGAKTDSLTLSTENGWSSGWSGLTADAAYTVEVVNPDTATYSIVQTQQETSEDGSTVTMIFTCSLVEQESEEDPSAEEDDEEDSPTEEDKKQDTPSKEDQGQKTPSGNDPGQNQPAENGQSQNMPAGMANMAGAMVAGFSDSAAMSDMSGFSAEGLTTGEAALEEAEEEEDKYLLEETSLCTLTADDQVTVNITIDELDILQIREGQKCTVTFDALEGQSFQGEIQKRNTDSENSGGNTKYTVTVILDKSEDLLLGMNANVSIPVEEKTDVLTIPESALQEDGSVFVYTGYDEKNDTLTDPVEVTTGLSDGVNVEILEGLEEGQQIYYRYADTISYTFAG